MGVSSRAPTAASACSRPPLVEVRKGPWRPHETIAFRPPGLGLLVLSGFVLREVALGTRGSCELLGVGDLLRPWEHEEGDASVPTSVRWRVCEPLTVAVLDAAYLEASPAKRQLYARLLDAQSARVHRAAVATAIAAQRRVDRRLHLLLWHLAERFGKVTSEGTVVPIRLTHATLAQLVLARRSSVTAALCSMQRRHLITSSQRGWILHGGPPDDAERQPRLRSSDGRVDANAISASA